MSRNRPLLPREDRDHLRSLSASALQHREDSGVDKSYAQGVADAFRWLVGDDNQMSPLLKQVTRS